MGRRRKGNTDIHQQNHIPELKEHYGPHGTLRYQSLTREWKRKKHATVGDLFEELEGRQNNARGPIRRASGR